MDGNRNERRAGGAAPDAKAAWIAIALGIAALPAVGQQLLLESPDGPVTRKEIDAFKTYMAPMKPAASNLGNAYAYGGTGVATEAFGLMYQITGDAAFLDKMMGFSDAMLAGRNDPVTGRILRTGRRELAWPNKAADDPNAAYTGSENGDVVGHIAFCARLILESPALWPRTAPEDAHGYGKTYRERALRYVAEMERTMDGFIVPNLVRRDSLMFYDAGVPIPWNQVAMLSNGFLRLAECHAILGDAPEKRDFYFAMVKSSYAKFQRMTVPYLSRGQPCLKWAYPQNEIPIRHMEDLGHSNYDALGLYRAWRNPLTAPPAPFVQAFANTLQFAIHQGDGKFASRVDGTNNAGESSKDNTYPGWLFMLEFIPGFYETAVRADLPRARNSVDYMSILLWAKHRRAGGATGLRSAYAGSPALGGIESASPGGRRMADRFDGTGRELPAGSRAPGFEVPGN